MMDNLDLSREIVNLTSASQHRLDSLGIVTFTVTVATQTTRSPFGAVRSLGKDIIFGCHYINRAVEYIQVQRRCIAFMNGSHAPIVHRRATIPTTGSSKEPKLLTRRSPTQRNVVHCAQKTILAPLLETNILVSCQDAGTKMLDGLPSLYEKSMVSLLNSIAKVIPEVPFVVRIANLPIGTVVLPKNRKVGLSLRDPLQEKIIAITFESDKETVYGSNKKNPNRKRPNRPWCIMSQSR